MSALVSWQVVLFAEVMAGNPNDFMTLILGLTDGAIFLGGTVICSDNTEVK